MSPNDILITPGVYSDTIPYNSAASFIPSSDNGVTDQYSIGNLYVLLNRVELQEKRDYNNQGKLIKITYPAEHDNLSWIVAFQVNPSVSASLKYGIYIDIDHVHGSGGSTDPLSKQISVNPFYLPEYVLYVDRISHAISSYDVTYYSCNGTGWDIPIRLLDLDGKAWYVNDTNVVQL